MNVFVKSLAALALLLMTAMPAAAQWAYSVKTEDGLEYAKASVKDASGHASIYTECTRNLSMGLALILDAHEDTIAQAGGRIGQILYINEAGDTALATVDYAPGEGVLNLVAPDPEEIEAAWKVFKKAKKDISVRFTFPPETQVYEAVFPAEGAAEVLNQLDAYCR
jgi:hypothetical protein